MESEKEETYPLIFSLSSTEYAGLGLEVGAP